MIRSARELLTASASEVQVLAALADEIGRTSAELVDEAGLLPEAVRSNLRQLQRRGVVCRSITGPCAGRWQ